MSKENDDFEKKFSEIINSEELKDISETYESEVTFGIKELLLVQRSLSDNLTHVLEIILSLMDGENLIQDTESEIYEVFCSLYKISEDFNDCVAERYIEFAIIDEDEDDDFLDEDEDENGEDE